MDIYLWYQKQLKEQWEVAVKSYATGIGVGFMVAVLCVPIAALLPLPWDMLTQAFVTLVLLVIGLLIIYRISH